MRKDKSLNVTSYEIAVFKAMRTIMHLVATVQFGYGCYFHWYYVHVPTEVHSMGSEFGGKLKFLTFCDAALQTIYFAIALLNDFIGSNENVPSKMPMIRRVKDYLFSSLAFPCALFVGITFWGIMAVDRELVFPKILDDYFPTWLNHLMHTNIMVFILLEMFLTFRQYPTKKQGLTGLSLFLIAYLIWMHVIYYYSGVWVYPIIEVLNWPLRILFYLGTLLLGVSLYALGEYLNNKLWSKQISQLKRSSRKRLN